jgi:hypothetical protein
MFVLRVQQQNSAVGGSRAMSLGTAFQRVVAAEGIRGLYRGNSFVTLNESLARGSFFASYNTLKRGIDNTGLAPTPLVRDIVASWAAALAFVTVSFPIVTVATRVAASDDAATASLRGLPRIAAAFRAVCEPHGARIGLTRGVSIALLRSACWMSIQMPLYDFLSRRLLAPSPATVGRTKKTVPTRG